MALIVDYGGLQTAVAEWLWRTGDAGLVARADAFIDLFEKGFKRNTRTLDMEETDTTVITGAAVALPWMDIPRDFAWIARSRIGVASVSPKMPTRSGRVMSREPYMLSRSAAAIWRSTPARIAFGSSENEY